MLDEIGFNGFKLFLLAEFAFKIESSHKQPIKHSLLVALFLEDLLFLNDLFGIQTGPYQYFKLLHQHLSADQCHVLHNALFVQLWTHFAYFMHFSSNVVLYYSNEQTLL